MKKIGVDLSYIRLNAVLKKNEEVKLVNPLVQNNSKNKCPETVVKMGLSQSIVSEQIKLSLSNQAAESVVLPDQLVNDIDSLRDILRDNLNFFDQLVKNCMKIGKEEGIFFNDIEKLLNVEYPNLTTAYTDGHQLIQTTYDLVKQLCVYEGDVRNQLEYVIVETFLSGDNYE